MPVIIFAISLDPKVPALQKAAGLNARPLVVDLLYI
jgi:hypothetical protein